MDIRQATAEDNYLPLVLEVLHDMELPLFNEVSDELVMQWMAEAMKDSDYRYAPNRCLVAVEEGVIIGIATSYSAEDEPILERAWHQVMTKCHKSYALFTEPETIPNEWYLDTLVVAKDARHKGVGTALLKATIRRAYEHGILIVGLNVDCHNDTARQLYDHIGFTHVLDCTLSGGHQYAHLQYTIHPSSL